MTNPQPEAVIRRESSIVALSDDLTGAVALAGEARRHAEGVRVIAWDHAVPRPRSVRALVVDTCSRLVDEAAARRRIQDVLAVVAESEAMMYKRVDSYLRGPIAAELDAWGGSLGGPLLIAAAAPAFGIRTLGGVQRAGSEPVTHAFPPGTVDVPRSAVIADLVPNCATIGLDAVRGSALADRLRAALGQGHVVCDGATPSDLYRVATAAMSVAVGGVAFSLVGSYGLADAWLRASAAGQVDAERPGVLIVTDSLKQATLDQVSAFAEGGGNVVSLDVFAGAPKDEDVEAWAAYLRAGRTLALTTADPSRPVRRQESEAARALAAITIGLVERARPVGLVVIGGELASSLMRLADCTRLDILTEPWPTSPVVRFIGGVLDQTMCVLKSGSRGEPHWLAHAVSLLAHLDSNDVERVSRR